MTTYKIKGIDKKTVRTCAEQTQVLLGLAKPKVKRKAETKPRKPYDRAEDRLRTEIVLALRRAGCNVFRLEPATRGKWGLSDLLVFTPKDKMLFVEVKTDLGIISRDQAEFKVLCNRSDEAYCIVRSVDQALDLI